MSKTKNLECEVDYDFALFECIPRNWEVGITNLAPNDLIPFLRRNDIPYKLCQKSSLSKFFEVYIPKAYHERILKERMSAYTQ